MVKILKPATFTLVAGFLLLLLVRCASTKNRTPPAQRQVFALTLESIGYSDIKKLYSADSLNKKYSFFNSPSIEENSIRFTAKLEKTLLQSEGDTVIFCLQFVNPSVQFLHTVLPIDSVLFQQEIITPFFIHQTTDGRIAYIQTDTSLSERASGFQREIISNLQFVYIDTAKWQVDVLENVTGGQVIAHYINEKNESGKPTLRKEIKGYQKFNSRRKEITGDIDFSGKLYLNTLRQTDSCSISVAQVTKLKTDTISAIGTKLSLHLLPSLEITADSAALLKGMLLTATYHPKKQLHDIDTDEEIKQYAYNGTLGNNNWETLMAETNNYAQLPEEERKNLVLKYRALFYLYPENAKKAVDLIQKTPTNYPYYHTITTALTITENEEACNAIVDIIKHRLKTDTLITRLFPALATTPAPTKNAMDFLMNISFKENKDYDPFIIYTAQLTASAMAKNFIKSDSLYAERQIDLICTEIEKQTDTLQHILVLGNMHSLKALPRLSSFINIMSTSQEVKLEAIAALQNIRGKAADDFIKTLIANKNEMIKKAAETVQSLRLSMEANE